MQILQDFKNHLLVTDMSLSYYHPVGQFLRYCLAQGIQYNDVVVINLAFIEGYMLDMKQRKLCQVYLDKHLKALRFFYKFLVNRQLIDAKVIEELYKLKLSRPARQIRDYITKEELDELIEMAWGWYEGMDMNKLKAVLYFLFFTGVRKNEFLNLKRAEINLDDTEALIKLPNKAKTERYVFFTKEVAKLVKTYFMIELEARNAFNISDTQLARLLKYLNDFTKKHVTPHTFRHSFAHYLARNRVDIKVAQKLLGHKNLASTEIYYDPDKETVKEIYKQQLG